MKATVPIEKYLRTAYHPDREYVDGEVLERNLGERDHSTLQRELTFFLGTREETWNVFVFPGQRVQVSPTRFRVPDICLYAGAEPDDQIFRTPPFICIEILSPEDRRTRMQQKIDDYLKFGVRYVFVLDPSDRRAWACTKDGNTEIRDGELRTENPSLAVPLAEIFGKPKP
jgi:Uma2 family endonuclease